MKTLVLGMVAFISCTSINLNNKNMETKVELSQKEKVVALLTSIETGDSAPVGYINAEKYIQHNLMVADGLAGFGEVLKNAPEGGFKANVVRAFQDGDYSFTHTEYDFFGPKIGFDIFRFENGKIVEHWDNLSEIAPPNPSGHTQIDGNNELKDIDKTEANKKLVKNMIELVLIGGEFAHLPEFIDGENYTQHNSHIADGLTGLGAAIEDMTKHGISMTYSKTHIVLGEGNFVLAVSEGDFNGKHVSYYDLFRVENNKIVEHWDVIEPILAKELHKNNNGKFGF